MDRSTRGSGWNEGHRGATPWYPCRQCAGSAGPGYGRPAGRRPRHCPGHGADRAMACLPGLRDCRTAPGAGCTRLVRRPRRTIHCRPRHPRRRAADGPARRRCPGGAVPSAVRRMPVSESGQLGARRHDPHAARTDIHDQGGLDLDADDPAEAVRIVRNLIPHGELLGRRSGGRGPVIETGRHAPGQVLTVCGSWLWRGLACRAQCWRRGHAAVSCLRRRQGR